MRESFAMKLNQRPEDFRVEEQTLVTPSTVGDFAFYRLEKQGWTTPDALAALLRRWQITPSRISYGGLNDRHADTVQFLTIFHGLRRNLTHQRIRVPDLGQTRTAYRSHGATAHRVAVSPGGLREDEARAVLARLDGGSRDGVTNYSDDQRFGSVSGGEFIGRVMVRGQLEEALRLALTRWYAIES